MPFFTHQTVLSTRQYSYASSATLADPLLALARTSLSALSRFGLVR
jgi:hypothetical protein